jgi:hypothetical protein
LLPVEKSTVVYSSDHAAHEPSISPAAPMAAVGRFGLALQIVLYLVSAFER